MVRKTALVTAMLGAFASQAFAMGLGEIRLNSVLNQPLHAEIELLSPTASDLAQLQVALAPSEAYARAGVERVFFHTKLSFTVVKRPNGSAYIKVTSREPVREPYLDFLVEATWGAGQVLREYTVLVDPPALMPAPRPTVTAPATAAMPREAYSPAAERVAGGLVDGQYHTQPSDTLWSIAQTVRPDGSVSMEQVMLGLLKANPDAFINGNINNLKAGQILRVPSRDEMTALSQGDALSEVRQQNTAWREGHSAPVAARAAAAPAPAPETAEPAEAPAAQPAAPAAQPAAEAQPDAQLKLLAPETGEAKAGAGTGTGSGQNVEELRKELTLAVEAVEARRQENQELNTRLKQLEDQIAQLHRMIELKDSEMAQLGATVAPGTSGEAAPQEPVAIQPATAEPVPGDTAAESEGTAESAGAEAAAEATAGEAEAVAEQAEPGIPVEAAKSEADTAAEQTSAAATVAPAPAEQPKPTPAAETPAEDTGLLATLLANPLLKWGAAGAAALVALLAWMGARRRRMQDTDFQESILADRKPKAAPAPSVAAPAAVAAAAAAKPASPASDAKTEAPARDAVQSDSSLFTDFAVSDMGALQNDAEADPVAEADVYLAYGRYQQAEELIRTALNRTPQRNDLRFKLLEVLYAAKNASGFDTEAEALLAALGNQDDETWQRVKEMGQELNPGSPLYRSGSAAAGVAPAAVAVADTSADSGLDFTPAAANADDNSLDFDMGELASFAPAEDTAALNLPIEEDFSFDLSAAEAEDEADGTLASSDEVATKLDLARAYIEMGDPEGARSILDEVMHEGSGAQKSEAQSLLSQIG